MGRVDENAELRRVIAEGAESGLMSDKLAELLYIQDIGKSLAVIADQIQPKRPTGKWIDIGDEGLVFKCFLCGMRTTIASHYCPNCGARMEEGNA